MIIVVVDNAKYDKILRDAEIKRSQLFIHKEDNNKSKKVKGRTKNSP